jgi:hypothetical protein
MKYNLHPGKVPIAHIHYSPEGALTVACGKVIVDRCRTHLRPAVTCPDCKAIMSRPALKTHDHTPNITVDLTKREEDDSN